MGRKPGKQSSSLELSADEMEKSTNIKERLNLHVKRRLQETPGPSFAVPSATSNDGLIEDTNPSANLTGGEKAQNTTKDGGSTRVGKRGKSKQSSDVAAKKKASNPTTGNGAGSAGPDDECSRDGNSSCNDVSREKDKKAPCLLTMALNAKKASLFRDPEVVQFLQTMVNAIHE